MSCFLKNSIALLYNCLKHSQLLIKRYCAYETWHSDKTPPWISNYCDLNLNLNIVMSAKSFGTSRQLSDYIMTSANTNKNTTTKTNNNN